MTEISGPMLASMQTLATAGLVVCLVLATAFAAMGFTASAEQDRRRAMVDTERMARIGALLREAEEARAEPAARPAAVPEAPKAAGDAVVTARTEAGDFASEDRVANDAASENLASDGAPSTLFVPAGPLPEVPPEALALLSPPPRRLAGAEAAALEVALADHAGGFSVEIVTAPEAEARLYALQLAGALRGAGIDARGPVAVLVTGQAQGLLVSAETAADGPGAALLSAMQRAGLPALPTPPGAAGDALAPDGADVRVYVGATVGAPDRAEPTVPVAPRARAPGRVLEDA